MKMSKDLSIIDTLIRKLENKTNVLDDTGLQSITIQVLWKSIFESSNKYEKNFATIDPLPLRKMINT